MFITIYIYSTTLYIGVGFERPISLWRTAYSTVTQSRSDLPDAIGAGVYIVVLVYLVLVIYVVLAYYLHFDILYHRNIRFIMHHFILYITLSYTPAYTYTVAWIAPYAPHHSTFVPVYASAEKTPSSLNTGTQCKLPISVYLTIDTYVYAYIYTVYNNMHVIYLHTL